MHRNNKNFKMKFEKQKFSLHFHKYNLELRDIKLLNQQKGTMNDRLIESVLIESGAENMGNIKFLLALFCLASLNRNNVLYKKNPRQFTMFPNIYLRKKEKLFSYILFEIFSFFPLVVYF